MPLTFEVRTAIPVRLRALFCQAADYHERGKFLEAVAAYNQIIAIKPNKAQPHGDLARALYSLGRYDDGLAACDRAIELEPGNAEFHNTRGYLLRAVGRRTEAVASYDRAVALEPDYAQAHGNRGNVLRDLGRYADAVMSYDRSIALKPDSVLTHRNRGGALNKLGRFDEALASYDREIALNPGDAEAFSYRGSALLELGRLEEAVASCDHAIVLEPNKADIHVNRGVVLQAIGRHVEALSCFNRAIEIEPHHAQAQHNKALLLLRLGDYESGLELHERRWKDETKFKSRKFTQPQWCGEPIGDKTILLDAEQGLGDKIQMLRYLPLVKAKAARVILEIPRTLRPLLGPMADGIVLIEPRSPRPSSDVHCSQMSLPFVFGTRVNTIPAQIPYLTVPTERMSMWQTRLPKYTTLRVGLVWSGSSIHENDRHRSIALDRLAPLLDTPGLSFVSLQREYRDSDLSTLARLPIERIDDAIRDFGDTAAAIKQCDLVISVDTAVAHLAGALGKPLWLLLPYNPDWRWLLNRTDSPWYPTAQLFRQTKIGDWGDVISIVVNELSALSQRHVNNRKMPPVAADSSLSPDPE